MTIWYRFSPNEILNVVMWQDISADDETPDTISRSDNSVTLKTGFELFSIKWMKFWHGSQNGSLPNTSENGKFSFILKFCFVYISS